MPSWEDSRFVAFDFETTGTLPEYALQSWRVKQGLAWPSSLVWAEKTDEGLKDYGGLDPTREMMIEMLERAIERKQTMVGWNTQFDVQWLLAYDLHDLVFKLRWLDGMLLWRHWFIEPEYEMSRPNKKSYGLKEAVKECLPKFAGYEEDIDFHSTDPAERAKLHRYNIRDVLFTLRLTKLFYNKLAEYPQRLKAALIEAECIPMIAEANLAGQMVDPLHTGDLQTKLIKDAEAAIEILAPHGVTEKVVRSPKQLGELMYDVWKLPVLKENTSKKTGKTTRSTDKEVLHELAFIDPRAQTLREYREALNNKTKFADTPLNSYRYNGDLRTHPQAIIFGTYSGRLTYGSKQGRLKADIRQTGFALHQEKRGKEFRNILIAPPGYTLVEFDAAGQEYRWMAIASGDETMLSLCEPGGDPHSYMGAQINDLEYEVLKALVKEGDEEAAGHRKLGKVANLSLQYRTSARKLRSVARVDYNLLMELPQAQLIWKTYQLSYVRVPEYWKKQIALTKARGWVETLAGRRVQVKGDWNGGWGWSMGSTSINYRIQGTGADQKYLAMMLLRPYLRDIGASFAWDLHDGIYFYVPNARLHEAIAHIQPMLDNLPYQKAWGMTPPIPMPWDCKTGASWGDLKDYKGP
jgi:DNA polymerase I-like protein with 3'-5' exonuclease and polymerase domains